MILCKETAIMPIQIQSSLPAIDILEAENIFVMTQERAIHQDIRPLKILILNIMPTKIETETQLLRLLGNSPLQLIVEFLQTATHVSKNTPASHLNTFYKTFNEVKHEKYDGMILTGAPIELLPFEEVDYWDELCEIMNWTRTNVNSTLHICWSAQAGLYYHYNIPKHLLKTKLSGIYKHKILTPLHPLMRGFDDRFFAPHSRNTTILRQDMDKHEHLLTLSVSNEAGVYIVAEKSGRQFFVTGHPEYDRNTLANEFYRDEMRGLRPELPEHYFPENDRRSEPHFMWKSHANLLFQNWLNYFVYQQTPFDLKDLSTLETPHKK